MATKLLGRVSIVPQGDYDENRVYKRLDLVKYDGKTYLSLREDNTNVLSDADSWMLLTESGSEALYTDDTLAGDILKRVDKTKGVDVNYRQVTTWHDGSVMDDTKVDGLAYKKFNNNYYKIQIEDYADVRMFGAKGDGVDGGLGNFNGDHDAINLALKVSKKVRIPKGVFIVKKPIILNDGNELYLDEDAVLKLGYGSNCTLLKNEPIDFPNTGLVDGVTYPSGFVKQKKIKINGKGIIDGNALGQFREGSAGMTFGGNPAVDNTPVFRDGDNMPYIGILMKFADVEFLEINDVTLKDSRTYHLAFGGIDHFKSKGCRSLRSVHLTNQDGFHAHGQCKLIEIEDLIGHSADDLFAVTTREAGLYSIRIGDVGKVVVRNITETGIDPDATIANPILAPLINNYNSFGPLRFSYTDENIDEIIVENVRCNMPGKDCVMILSNLPNANTISGNPYGYGSGKIRSVSVSNLRSYPNSRTPIGLGGYTKIDKLTINDIDHDLTTSSFETALIRDVENFSGVNAGYENNHIGLLTLNNVICTKGNSNPGFGGIVSTLGVIDNLTVNNFTSIVNSDSVDDHQLFAKGKIKFISINGSKMRFKTLLDNGYLAYWIRESNNEFAYYQGAAFVGITLIGTPPYRANTSNIEVPIIPDATMPGDKILTASGYYIFVQGTWQKMNP